ncbi:hypothetical protein L3Q82_019818 [Scortum barcoo]|uniref:Uncharacterized protein n=1 Tax=Scortum barcoo TaxID=214431 RepID=A0ACB8VCN6_9TELE|nr:hypothetical protein L3Q82_019818 [Scortum barcoo]
MPSERTCSLLVTPQAAMEVVVTEEKKKIFRARKTMKISDRQQLETLHSTLLTAAPGLSDTSPPPLMNGTHKEEGQKVGDKEQNNVSDSNSPRTTSPASPTSLSSPAPFLSLNLSPSPASSQSPKEKDGTPTSPTSPFHSLNFELKKMEDEEEEDEEKKGSASSSANESVTPASTESKKNQERDARVIPEKEKKGEEKTTTDDPAVDLAKDSDKGLVPCSPVPPTVSDCTEPMDTDSDTPKAKDSEASSAKTKDEKPSSPKTTTSDSSHPCPSSSRPASSSCADLKQEKEIKVDIKEEKNVKEDVKEESKTEAKMEVDSVKVETKKEKTDVRQTTKQSRPSSTPPSNTVQEERGSTSGLKRTLSEGYEKEEQTIKREGKRPKVEREELEAQLELKITAKAGSHHKLEKIVQQLVDERLRVLELTIFDKHFGELKDRVEKIDCATKHQTAINTLQAKISRLAKKFGEANQASENKRKQEALAAVTAAAAAAKTATVANNPQRVLRRQAVEPQPVVPRERVAPSVGKTPVLPNKKEKKEEEEEEMEEEENKDMSRHIAMAKKLAEYNEGKCRADIKLRTITSHLEKVLYHNCKRSSGNPRPDRYASYIFRYLVPYDVYCDWVAKVNYVGLLGKEALPTNLRVTMRMQVRTSVELKQTPTIASSSSTAGVKLKARMGRINMARCQPLFHFFFLANPALPATAAAPVPTPTSTAMVTQAPILQLITSTSNAASTLAAGITTQSPTGTLLLKTAPGSSMVATGQPLLIQLPLSMTNGQAGTLVNIPVTSLSAASSLNKAKTTASTATFILKPAPAITTAPASGPAAATVPALQASPAQMPSAQISLARAVYQGGAGGITTPNAGVSMTTARTPAQSVSVAGAMSSASSPATSGPAATGSTAPGPPQGTSLTSKTDNQATGSTPFKATASAPRPKGSVIDLTEDDDDVQVTGVKNATAAAPSPSQRPNPVVSSQSRLSNEIPPCNPLVRQTELRTWHCPLFPQCTRASTVTSPEAERYSPPQQPQLKLVPSQTGIVLSWCVAETDRTCAAVDSYHLYAFHQDNSNSNAAQQHWKKIGEVKALPLPMACTLTQFQSGSTYHFAVRAKDIYGRFGSFCEPQCTNVISSSSS